MHFYYKLITLFFPFVPLNQGEERAPTGEKFVVNYQGTQVVTYQGNILIEKGS